MVDKEVNKIVNEAIEDGNKDIVEWPFFAEDMRNNIQVCFREKSVYETFNKWKNN